MSHRIRTATTNTFITYEYFFYTVYNQLLATYGLHRNSASGKNSMSGNNTIVSARTSNTLRGVGPRGGHELQTFHDYGTTKAHAEGLMGLGWFGSPWEPQRYFDLINTFYGLGFSGQLSPNGLSSDERSYYYGFSRWFHTTPPPSSRHIFGGGYPPMTNETYVVNKGDTLEDIARQTQGDPSFAQAIAMANGWSMSEPLKAGQILRIPQFIPQMSNVDTSVPYQVLMSILIRNIAPHLNTPQPDEDFFDALLSIVITVVACVVAPELAPAFLVNAVGASIAIGVTAALIEAAEQGVLVGFGLKEHFSLVEAIETGISCGVAKWANLSDVLKKADLLKELQMVGIVALSNQLQELALGRIKQINFRSLFNSMLATFAGGKIGIREDLSPMEQAVVTDMIEISTSQLIMGYSPSAEMIAAQLLGTVIGNELGDIANKQIDKLKASTQRSANETKSYAAQVKAASKANSSTTTLQPKAESKASRASQAANQSTAASTRSVADPAEANLYRLLGLSSPSNPYADPVSEALGICPNVQSYNPASDEKPPTVIQSSGGIGKNLLIGAERSLANTWEGLSALVEGISYPFRHPVLFFENVETDLKGLGQLRNLSGGELRELALHMADPSSITENSSVVRDVRDLIHGNSAAKWQAVGSLGTDALTFFAGGAVANEVTRLGGLAADLWEAKFFPNGVEKLLNPYEIRFTQESVSFLKNRPGGIRYTLSDITDSMSRQGWVGEPIDIIKTKNGYSTVDNSRVLAAREVGVNVRARVHRENVKLPSDIRSRFKDPKNSDVKAERWGKALDYRIMRQSKAFRDMYLRVRGTYNDPIVTYPQNYPD